MQADKIKFYYVKSNHFKSFFANGAYGGLGPNGLINIAFYIERPAIPKAIVHDLEPDGKLGKEITSEREGKSGVIREVDCNIMMDLNTAKTIRGWLDRHITMLEKVIEETKTKTENNDTISPAT